MSETTSPNGKSDNGKADVSGTAKVISLNNMYQDYFLDYASYVILERAVPAIDDGLKPVQRRILHSMKMMDDGRYHKVANIIGNTMKYHPHGDAAIGDALVNLGQKDLLIDPQGNWGDTRTGDRAAASRYIEARLTKFALDVAFNPQTTEWQVSYDGRNKEPLALPMKFPLLLAQGVEGIAVGLATKIMPHNFVELIKASIKLLNGKSVTIYPDFYTGGSVDITDYRGGKRGGKIKVRARIEQVDKKSLAVRDLPYGVTTGSLIESIVKANDKGQIKIKKVVDNTAEDVEVLIDLATGVSPEVTMDALYAFTRCEESISPNACVIIEDKPHFMTVEEILKINTAHTKALLKMELEIRQRELEEKLHFASLEKIFIQNRIYRKIEECETWEAVIETIDKALQEYVSTPSTRKKSDKRIPLLRDVTEDDIVRLTEIKIKRISKYNSFKADELIARLEEELQEVKHHLEHLTAYAIAYFENLLKKYAKGKERRTVITTFDTIQATQVVANNAKLYANYKEGFIGTGLKRGEGEYISDCSDIDDIIVFRKDGKFLVTRVSDKAFVGKNLLHVAVWKKGDERTTYNMAYLDASNGRMMGKRFNVKAITRDKEYDLTKGAKGSKMLYFTANPNGEAEVISVQLTAASTAKVKNFDFDFGELAIKGRAAGGNIVSRYPVRKITQKEVGQSTLGALEIYMDEVSGRLNTDKRGQQLGGFDTGDQIFVLYKDGSYELTDYELTNRYEIKEIVEIRKFDPDLAVSAVYYEGGKKWTLVKRFKIETTSQGQRFEFITDNRYSKLLYATTKEQPIIKYNYREKNQKLDAELKLAEFIDVKGWKAMGNKLVDQKITGVKDITPKPKVKPAAKKLKPGDSIDFEIDNGQTKMF
ncbi:MAG: DNA gyrase/topoisomerase IV subunit A [Saprospiraceae bacterium]